jgi:hypothetical protein
MKITEDGQIKLTYEEHMRTRDIEFTWLSCGCYITPPLGGLTYHQEIRCPACGKKAGNLGQEVIKEGDDILQGTGCIKRRGGVKNG